MIVYFAGTSRSGAQDGYLLALCHCDVQPNLATFADLVDKKFDHFKLLNRVLHDKPLPSSTRGPE